MDRFVRYLPILFIALAIAAFFGSDLHGLVSIETLRAQRDALDAFVDDHRLAAVALYLVSFVTLILLSLPVSFVMTVAGGYLFGPTLAVPLALIAVTGGSTLFVVLTRSALGALMRDRLKGRLARLERGFKADAFNYLLVLRLTPAAPVFLTNLAAGLVGMKLKHFALATFLGLIPVTIVFAGVGHGLRAAFEAGLDADPVAAARRLMLSPEVILPIMGLIALSLLPVAMKRRA